MIQSKNFIRRLAQDKIISVTNIHVKNLGLHVSRIFLFSFSSAYVKDISHTYYLYTVCFVSYQL